MIIRPEDGRLPDGVGKAESSSLIGVIIRRKIADGVDAFELDLLAQAVQSHLTFH